MNDPNTFLTKLEISTEADCAALKKELTAVFVPMSNYYKDASTQTVYVLLSAESGFLKLLVAECSNAAAALYVPAVCKAVEEFLAQIDQTVTVYCGNLPTLYKPSVLSGTYPSADALLIKNAFENGLKF